MVVVFKKLGGEEKNSSTGSGRLAWGQAGSSMVSPEMRRLGENIIYGQARVIGTVVKFQ